MRSYLCSGSVAQMPAGTSVTIQSNNGNSGSLKLSCLTVTSGSGTTYKWNASLDVDPTTKAPINVSCGVYTSAYRSKTTVPGAYLAKVSSETTAAQSMWGVGRVVRNLNPDTMDIGFNLNKTEGPASGYSQLSLGFMTVHQAATQDLGLSTNTPASDLITRVYSCYSVTKLRHYVNITGCTEGAGDIQRAILGYIFKENASPNNMLAGITLNPLFRCYSATGKTDIATSDPVDCANNGGPKGVLGQVPYDANYVLTPDRRLSIFLN